jgi:hypothetical protein
MTGPRYLLYFMPSKLWSVSFQLEHYHLDQDLMGIQMDHGTKDINHAQFVADTLLLGGARMTIARKFKVELDYYCRLSESKLNHRKSYIFNWHISPRELADISRILEIEGTSQWDFFKYLGFTILKSSLKDGN